MRYRVPRTFDPRILANTRGEYPVSDSPRRVNTRLAIFQASHSLGTEVSIQGKIKPGRTSTFDPSTAYP
jgi:hypothetical protein